MNHEQETTQNACCNCKEGYVVGEKVYCNYDGRFHPLYDNFKCKHFLPKNETNYSTERGSKS